MTDEPITRRDLEAAVQVTALSVQMSEVMKDLGQLNLRMDQHEQRHEAEKKERVVNRRWMIGIAVACLSAIDGPLIYLIQAHR